MSDVQYKLVDGELQPLTPEDLAQINWDQQHPPPRPPDPVDAAALATLANSRIDAGVEAGYEAVNQVGEQIGARMRMRREITTDEIEQQLAALTEAVLTMIRAQRTVEPPTPPPVTPVTPIAPAASRKKGARK